MRASQIDSLKLGDIHAEKCVESESDKTAKRLRSCAQMYKHRKRKQEPDFKASYKVYKVIGAVIIKRTL